MGQEEVGCQDLKAAIAGLQLVLGTQEDESQDLIDAPYYALFPVLLRSEPLGDQALLQFIDANCASLPQFFVVRVLPLHGLLRLMDQPLR